MGVRVVFSLNYPLVISLLKHRDVRVFKIYKKKNKKIKENLK